MMDKDRARSILILCSLAITGFQMAFLVVAPSLGYPLSYPDNIGILQIVSPVFLGYLGSATHFVFSSTVMEPTVKSRFLGPLVLGPLIIYFIVVLGAFIAFGFSNRIRAEPGTGMSVDNLSTALSSALGLLAVTTGVVSSYLFVSSKPN